MNYNKIIFDLDGVITSELMYWHAAALTVYELLFEDIDVAHCMENTEKIYNIIFCDGRTVALAKSLGVNSNWDLAFIVWCISRHLGIHSFEAKQFQKTHDFIMGTNLKAPELYDYVCGLMDENELCKKSSYSGTSADGGTAEENTDFNFSCVNSIVPVRRGDGEAWNKMLLTFQHWFHGTDIYTKKYGNPKGAVGRKGLASRQQPIIPLAELHKTLSKLKERGITLGIGTGRPADEADYPLELWDIKKYFTAEHCATYSDVEQAEFETGRRGELGKPNPFVFLKAAVGDKSTSKQIIQGEYDRSVTERVLVVGDSIADLRAAKAAGFHFAAVLTGAGGEQMKEKFEKNGAKNIRRSVKEIY